MAVSAAPAPDPRPTAPAWERLVGPLTLSVAGLSVLAVLVTAVRLAGFLEATYRNADAAAQPLIAGAVPGGVVVPKQTGAAALFFDWATGWVPGHRVAWLLFGVALGLVTAALIMRSVWLLAGRTGAAVAALALCVPPVLLWKLLMQDNHATTVAGTALLGWAVLQLWRQRLGSRAALAVGLAAGLCEVSDPEFLVAGAIPFAVALMAPRLLAGARTGWRPLQVLLVGAFSGWAASELLLRQLGARVVDTLPVGLSLDGVAHGLRLAIDGAGWTVGAGWYGDEVSLPVRLLSLAAVMVPPLVLLREVRAARARRGTPERVAWVAFWTACEVLLVAALLGSGLSTSAIQAHYVVQAFYAVAAVLPLLLEESAAWAGVAAGLAALFALHTTYSLATFDANRFALDIAPSSSDLASLQGFLEGHGLSRGYTGYWDAFPLTWRSDGAVTAWPAMQGDLCKGDDPGSLCRYGFSADSWYQPRGGPTFVAARSTGCLPGQPSQAYGTPTATYRVGPWTVWVYPDDVAAHFVEPFAPLCVDGFHRSH